VLAGLELKEVVRLSPQFQTTDAELALLNRLREHGLLEIADLEVRVRQGTAYIEGSVPNLKQKKLAGELASRVEGIREVVNMLRIMPLPVVDDESLKQHLKRALVRNPRIDHTKLSVEVINGVVYLGGFASTAAEKHLAEHEAWATPGVRDIINKIEVLSASPKSEMQIVGEIMEGLSYCLGLDLAKITVDFQDGTIRLRGTVPSAYLKEAAEELASWTPSVNSVSNELEVLDWPGSRRDHRPRLIRSSNEDCLGRPAQAASQL